MGVVVVVISIATCMLDMCK